MKQALHFNYPYELIITVSPDTVAIPVYGILNTVTGVTEAYVAQLARAKHYCDLYARELKEGIYDEVQAAKDFLASLKEPPPKKGGGSTGSPLN